MHYAQSKDNMNERRSIIESYYLHKSNSKSFSSEMFADYNGFLHKSFDESTRITAHQTRFHVPGLEKLELSKNSRKLKKVIKSGVPNALRSTIWKEILDVEKIIMEKRGIYKKILIEALRHSPHVRQIHLDIQRTFRDHISFNEEFGLKQVELFNVLLAYSIYNIEVGYCQGMSEVAAILLMFMSEEQAFWGFERLFSNRLYNLHGIFTLHFPRLFCLQKHHDYLLRHFSKGLYKHIIKKNEITAPLYTFRWFMQCFVGKIPFFATLRLYDMFLLEGDTVLTVMSFVVMRLLRRDIKSCDFEGIMKLFNKSPLIPEEMIDRLFRKYKKYKRIFEREKCQTAPMDNQTWPTEPILLTDPLRYARENAFHEPREITFENIVADGVRNIKSKINSLDFDDMGSLQSDDSPESIESSVIEISSPVEKYFSERTKKNLKYDKILKETYL